MDLIMIAVTWAAATAIIGVWIFLGMYQRLSEQKRRGPKAWPFIGSVCELVTNVEHLHDWLLKYSEIYSTFSVPTPGRSFIYTVDPSIIEYVVKTNFHNYGKGTQIPGVLWDLYGGGLYTADGEDWKWHLKTTRHHFLPKVLRTFAFNIGKEFAVKGATILAKTALEAGKKEIDMQDFFTRMAFDSTCKFVCGVDTKSLSEGFPHVPFVESFENAEILSFKRAVDPFWKLKRVLGICSEADLKKNLLILNGFMHQVITSRRLEISSANPENVEIVNCDMLSRVLLLCKDDPRVSSTDKDIRDMLMNTLEGGRCTIANTLSWAWYLLCLHPPVQEKLLHEIQQTMDIKDGVSCNESAACGGIIDDKIQAFSKALNYEILSKMQYLQATITETLRLYPAIPINSREALAADTLPDGTRVKKGDLVGSVPYSMGRMKFLWGSDAKEFKPERWLKDNVFVAESPFKFSVFGAGQRSCVGKDAAYIQMKITVATLVKFFKFRMVPGHVVKYRLAPSFPMTAAGIHVKFELR